MSSNTSQRSNGIPAGPRRTLTERVTARIAEAGLAIDERDAQSGVAPKRARPSRMKQPATRLTEGTEAERDARSLRRVYREMRTTYQGYRQQSGTPSLPALREAVHAFKRGQSLTTLVAVAAFLDDRGLLTW